MPRESDLSAGTQPEALKGKRDGVQNSTGSCKTYAVSAALVFLSLVQLLEG